MKIIYCMYGLYNSGGMERVLSIKANYLAEKLGYDVHIVTTNEKGRIPFYTLSSKIKLHDLSINYADENENTIAKKILPFPFKLYRHWRLLKTLLYHIKPDITISMFGNDIFLLPFIKDGSKKIIESHFSKYHRLQLNRNGIFKYCDIIRAKLDNFMCSFYDKVIVLTNEDKNNWKEKFRDKVIVIPNPCVLSVNRQAELDNKQVLAIGRLTPQKGFDILIDIWEIVHRNCPDWKLKIIGSGILYTQLIEQVHKKQLQNTITLQNVVSNNIAHEYLDSSIFALSSRYEGFPMVLLESAMCGLPVVAFSCKCGPKDIIENGINGFLIREGSISEFASSLITLINNEKLRKKLGSNLYKKSKEFSLSSIMNKWSVLFNDLSRC